MEKDFYATIKFKSGEEILSKVAPCDEEDRILLVLSMPVIVEEVAIRSNVYGYKFEPWLKTSSDDMFIVDMENVLTMTENTDLQILSMYEKYMEETSGQRSHRVKPDRDMGYVISVSDAKKLLEKLYNKNTQS